MFQFENLFKPEEKFINCTYNELNYLTLENKAKSMFFQGLYNDANELLTLHPKFSDEIFELKQLTTKILEYESKYNFYSNLNYAEDWMEYHLLKTIKKTKQQFLKENPFYTEKDLQPNHWTHYNDNSQDYVQSKANKALHEFNCEKNNEVFILGPRKLVNTFNNLYDNPLIRCLDTKLTYPYAQGNRKGFIHTIEQNFYSSDLRIDETNVLNSSIFDIKEPKQEKNDDIDKYFSIEKYKADNYDYKHGESDVDSDEEVDAGPLYIAPFPIADWTLDKSTIMGLYNDKDVYYIKSLISPNLDKLIKSVLDKHAERKIEYYSAKEGFIIDPYSTCNTYEPYLWSATNFIVEEVNIKKFDILLTFQLCMKRLHKRLGKNILIDIRNNISYINRKLPKAHIAAPISNIPITNKDIYVIVEELFNIALPYITQFTRPALLLPGKFQAVIEAKRIVLKPNEDYSTSWNRVGYNENVVAVVSYFYNVSEELLGGDLELIDKKSIVVQWGSYGCRVSDNDVIENIKSLPYCRIPIKEGTLVIFSNYQMVHRFLKMECPGGIPFAGRDCITFYIIDQSKPLKPTEPDAVSNLYDDRLKSFEIHTKLNGKFSCDIGTVGTNQWISIKAIGWSNDEGGRIDSDDYDYIIDKLNKVPPRPRGISWSFEQEAEEEVDINDMIVGDMK
jgi:hypothetical protein